MLKQKREGFSGFTLIELVVAIAIMAILSAIVLANYRGTSGAQALARASQSLSVDIRRAQNLALSAALLPGGSFPLGGYGIYFPSSGGNSYILFADKNGNQIYDSNEQLDNIVLESGISFSGFKDSQGNNNVSNLTAIFCPPYLNTLLYSLLQRGSPPGPCSAGSQARSFILATLSTKGSVSSDSVRNVCVYASGLVDVLSDNQLRNSNCP